MTDRPRDLSRREFLQRAARGGITLAGAGALAWALHDDRPPSPRLPGPAVSGEALPDFSVRDDGPRMAIVTGTDRARALSRALEALGGAGRFVRRGETVLVKPNAGFATPPELCATTHPDAIGTLVRMCLAAGAARVIVTDNPVNDPETSFRLTGIAQAARDAGAEVVVPREAMFRQMTVPGATLLRDWPILAGPFEGVDRVIGLCPVKDHVRSGATMALKNWYGLLGGRRNLFHQRISEVIRDLALLVRPTLVLLDGTRVLRRNGPTGGSLDDVEDGRTFVASLDPVAADAFGATLLGRTAGDLPWLGMAAAAGAGTVDWESLAPRREAVD